MERSTCCCSAGDCVSKGHKHCWLLWTDIPWKQECSNLDAKSSCVLSWCRESLPSKVRRGICIMVDTDAMGRHCMLAGVFYALTFLLKRTGQSACMIVCKHQKENICRICLAFDSSPKEMSYRRISLLSCFSKALEGMIIKQLMWHLETNNLIAKEQTTFRKNKSTKDQLIYLAQSIENTFQKKKKIVAIFIDLFKAFSKV